MIIDVYRSLLRFAGLSSDEDGFIHLDIKDKKEPVLVNGLRLVLPTQNQLKNFNPTEKIIFHPLAEDILKPESEVLKKFREIINVRLNTVTGVLSQTLMHILTSPEFHKNLNSEQFGILEISGDSDKTMFQNYVKLLLSNMKGKEDRVFTNIFLKKGGTFEGKKYSKVGIVTFPFFANIKTLKCREKDKKAFEKLMKYMFPIIEEEEGYNFGSSSRVAPNLEAIMGTAVNIAAPLNDLLDTFSEYLEEGEADMLKFDSDWLEYFQDTTLLVPEIRKIPAHPEHIQTLAQPENNVNIQDHMNTAIVQKQQQAPQVQNQYPQTQQPMHNQNYPMNHGQIPNQGMMPGSPNIVKTEGGIDFRATMMQNPQLQNFYPNQFNMNQPMPQMNMRNQPPSWAFTNQFPQQGQFMQMNPWDNGYQAPMI